MSTLAITAQDFTRAFHTFTATEREEAFHEAKRGIQTISS